MQQIQQGRTTTGAVNAAQLDTTTATNAGARTATAAGKMALPLLQRLNDFSGEMLDIGTDKMIVDAKEQAVKDVSEGKLNLIEDGTIYGRAYDGAGKTAYLSSTTKDIKAQSERVAAENKYSPEAFDKAWKSHTAAISKSSREVDSNGYISAVLGDISKQYGDAAYTKIASNLATQQRALHIKENEESLVLLEDEYVSAMVSGDENAIASSVSSMRATISSMYNTQQIGEKGIESKWKLLSKRVVKEVVRNEFSNEMTQGTATSYISNFRENVKKSPNFKDVTPTEVNEMMDEMYSVLGKKQSFEDSQDAQEKKYKEKASDDLKAWMDEAWLTQKLTPDDVDAALDSELITPAEHKAYSLKVFDTGDKFTNTTTELNIVQNLAALSVNDIMNTNNVTNEDKMKYIKKLRTYQASDEGKWTSTVQGRSALTLLRTHYDIAVNGLLGKSMGAADDIERYKQLYQSFILEMEDLPADEREFKAMHYAQAATDALDRRELEKGATRVSGINANEEKDLQKRVTSYQRQIGQKKSSYYIQGLAEFSKNFGTTGDIKFNKVDWSK